MSWWRKLFGIRNIGESKEKAESMSTSSTKNQAEAIKKVGIDSEKAIECSRRGAKYLNQKQYKMAVSEYLQAIKYDRENPTWWTNVGAICMIFVEQCLIPYVGKDFRIMVLLFDVSGRITLETKTYAKLGLETTDVDRLEKLLQTAEHYLNEAAVREKKASLGHYWLAILYRNTGRFEKAKEGFRLVAASNCSDSSQAADKSLTNMNSPSLDWSTLNRERGPEGEKAIIRSKELFEKELIALLEKLDQELLTTV